MSIRLLSNGLSFLYLNKKTKEIEALQEYVISGYEHISEYELYINKILEKEIGVGHTFENVILSIHSPKSMLIPLPFFEQGQERQLYAFTDTLSADQEVLTKEIKPIEAVQLWVVSSKLKHILDKFFPEAIWQHYSYPILEQQLKQSNSDFTKDSISIGLNKEFLDIIVINKGKLRFFNTFRYKTKEDALYYLLSSFKQLNLNPEKIIIEGYLENHSLIETITFLQNYIPNINFPTASSKWIYSKELTLTDKPIGVAQTLDLECVL